MSRHRQKQNDDDDCKRSYIGYATSYNKRDADEVNDSRYVWNLKISGCTDVLRGVIPLGAARLKFIYDYNPVTRVIKSFPRLSHSNGIGMTAEMLVEPEKTYRPVHPNERSRHYKFSLICLLYPREIGSFISSNYPDSRLKREFDEMVTFAEIAMTRFDRDVLSVVYAQIDTFMETYFGMDFLTTQMLDIEELFKYLRGILERGPYAMLRPTQIHLSTKLNRPSTIKIPVADQGDSEYEQDTYDRDEAEFDYFYGRTGRDVFSDTPRPYRTLLLKNMTKLNQPKNQVIHDEQSIRWTSRFGRKDTFIIASFNEHDVKFPVVDLTMLTSFDWHKFAIHRYVGKAFTRDKHYYCTLKMIDNEIARIGKEPEEGKHALFPVRLFPQDTERAINELVSCGELHHSCVCGVDRFQISDAYSEEIFTKTTIESMIDHEKQTMFSNKSREVLLPVIRNFSDRELVDEQLDAVYGTLKSRFSIIVGPGGSGKTMILNTLQRIFRAEEPDSTFLFTSFKNGIVTRMDGTYGDGFAEGPILRDEERDMASVLDGDSELESDYQIWMNGRERVSKTKIRLELAQTSIQPSLNIYRTLDSIGFGYKKSRKSLEFRVVFVEEAGQMSGGHLANLFSALNTDGIVHFILIGDDKQRAPIKQGTPFKSLIEQLEPHGFVHRLSKVHRTDSELLILRQNFVMVGLYKQALAAAETGPFTFDKQVPSDKKRMSPSIMKAYARRLSEWLRGKIESGASYNEIMGLCPYNDYCDVGNAVFNAVFFGAEDFETVIDRDIMNKKRDNPFVCVGSRIVFNVTEKCANGGQAIVIKKYARGELGIVRKIIDILKNEDDEQPISSTEIASTITPIPQGFCRKFVIETGCMSFAEIVVKDAREISKIFSQAGFITGDRAQGLEFPHVVALFPWGQNLATRDMVTSIWGRPSISLHVIGQYDHLRTMICTPPEKKNYSFDDENFIIYTPSSHTSVSQWRINIINPPTAGGMPRTRLQIEPPAESPIDDVKDDHPAKRTKITDEFTDDELQFLVNEPLSQY